MINLICHALKDVLPNLKPYRPYKRMRRKVGNTERSVGVIFVMIVVAGI